MKKIVTILLLALCIQCKTGEYYPPANRHNFIKDSFYYCRDTMNFYQVDMSNRLAQSLGSVFENVPLISENHYWTISLHEKSLRTITGQLAQNHCEEVFLDIEIIGCPYKAIRIKGKIVFILDPYGAFNIIQKSPFIKIKNPHELKAIYNEVGGQFWSLKIDKKGKLIIFEEDLIP